MFLRPPPAPPPPPPPPQLGTTSQQLPSVSSASNGNGEHQRKDEKKDVGAGAELGLDVPLDVGTVVKIKGCINEFRGVRQLEGKRTREFPFLFESYQYPFFIRFGSYGTHLFFFHPSRLRIGHPPAFYPSLRSTERLSLELFRVLARSHSSLSVLFGTQLDRVLA